MEIADALVATLGAIAGGGITGYYTLRATDKAIRDADNKEVRRDETEVNNLLDALSVEMKTLWDFHMKRIGKKIEELKDGEPLEMYYPLTQDYFTIYNSNASLIGRIKDCDLSEAIVVCYNKCKKAVDAFKYNNDLLKDFRDEKAPKDALVEFASIIKEDHFELKSYVERMLKLIKDRA